MRLRRIVSTRTGGFGAPAALAVLACLATAACVPSSPAPTPPPAPPRAPAPPPPPVAVEMPAPAPENWMDAPQTQGDWRYRPLGGTSRASFGDGAGAPLFEMACESGAVRLIRGGTGGGAMRILTETAERTLTAAAGAGVTQAELAARDPLLDAMAFSKGRFAVEVAGLPTLYLPAWPEVTRVIEDCR